MQYKQLTENERYQISSLMKAGNTQKQIACILGRSPSTISREVNRNRGQKGYRPKQAHEKMVTRRCKAYKAIKITQEVYGWIVRLLRQELSPQQVVTYIKKHKRVSLHHESIYQLIYRDKAQQGDLYTHLRIASRSHRKRYGKYDRRGTIKNKISIDERPAIVDRKSRVGDWEGDTVMGKGRKSALLTLVERKTLYTVIARLKGKHADKLADVAINCMAALSSKVKTITFDNGLEFAHHSVIAEGLNADIYFAHPYCSWERGINENTNGLIRQYFPKGTDFSVVSDKEIQFVMDRLNNRPRATRRNKSPNELFKGQRVDLLAA